MSLLNVFAFVVKFDELVPAIIATLIFVVIGLVFFGLAYLILHFIMPFSIRKEIEVDQNTSLGIIIGSMLIGIAIIIAAAIMG
jgi:uncharacterized membrane protein YjfL (UPF0719 family)